MAKLVSANTSYKICRYILRYGPKYRKKGKKALQNYIAKKLGSSSTTIRHHAKTINAVLGEGEPAKDYGKVYEELCADGKFKRLAKKAMKVYEAVERVEIPYAICERIIEYGPKCRKGKTALREYIAKKIGISADNITNQIQTFNAVLGKGKPAGIHEGGENNRYTALCADEEFKKLAKRAVEQYEQVGHIGNAYSVCELILEYASKCKKGYAPKSKRGKDDLKNYIGDKLKISIVTIQVYLQTINAILGKGKAAKVHTRGEANIYTRLSDDEEFKELAKKAMWQYEVFHQVGRAYSICELIIKYGPKCEKGRLALKKDVADELGLNVSGIDPYIKTINSSLGKGEPALAHGPEWANVCTALKEDNEFKKLAREAMLVYATIGAAGHQPAKKPYCQVCGGFLMPNPGGKRSHKCSKCEYETDFKP